MWEETPFQALSLSSDNVQYILLAPKSCVIKLDLV